MKKEDKKVFNEITTKEEMLPLQASYMYTFTYGCHEKKVVVPYSVTRGRHKDVVDTLKKQFFGWVKRQEGLRRSS